MSAKTWLLVALSPSGLDPQPFHPATSSSISSTDFCLYAGIEVLTCLGGSAHMEYHFSIFFCSRLFRLQIRLPPSRLLNVVDVK